MSCLNHKALPQLGQDCSWGFLHVPSLSFSLCLLPPPPLFFFHWVGVYSAGVDFWINILGLACLAPPIPPLPGHRDFTRGLSPRLAPKDNRLLKKKAGPRHREARDGKGFPRSSGELPPGKARSRPVPLQGQAAEHWAPAVPAWSLTVLITHRRLEALPAHCPLSQRHSSASHAPPVYTGSPCSWMPPPSLDGWV